MGRHRKITRTKYGAYRVWKGYKRKTEYSLSSESTPRLTISDVLFCRRNNFCLVWHLDIWAAQSTCTFDLHIRHRRPCLVWPFLCGGNSNMRKKCQIKISQENTEHVRCSDIRMMMTQGSRKDDRTEYRIPEELQSKFTRTRNRFDSDKLTSEKKNNQNTVQKFMASSYVEYYSHR